jgi:acetate kinase
MAQTPENSVLVVDAGSHSLALAVVDGSDAVLAEHRVDTANPGAAGGELAAFVESAPPFSAVGHRFVHGGEAVRGPRLVDDGVRRALEQAASLAPLHVPAALSALDTARTLLPDAPHVACLDTAFHAGLPPIAATYAVPRRWREEFGVHRYGFHGLSYAWASARAAALLGRPPEDLELLVTHLGNGSSVCAVRSGHSVDTSMGFTPLEGLVMGTRSGSVDPGLLLWLITERGLSPEKVAEDLERNSGLLGLSVLTHDTRHMVAAAANGNVQARLALDVFSYRAAQGLAAAACALDRVDALVFTGEIGEDQPEVRQAVCARLHHLGVPTELAVGNPDRDAVISPSGASVPVLVVLVGERQQIARETRVTVRDAAAAPSEVRL